MSNTEQPPSASPQNAGPGSTVAALRRWSKAFAGFYRPDDAEADKLDAVSKFLYSARSVILVISVQAGVIAGLLAAGDRDFNWLDFVLVLAGFAVAHMISNLSNDYFGHRHGHDTADSPRMRYTMHPLASGVLDPRTLRIGLGILSAIGIMICGYFVLERGWLAVAFLVPGVALLFAYDAARLSLKTIGLGEIAVFVVWGPLMVGGGYAMITGHVSSSVFYASVPYGLGVMSILIAKHLDQRDFDSSKEIRTLPVLMGGPAARRLNIGVVALMYIVIAVLIGVRHITPFSAAVIVALPHAVRAIATMAKPRPATAPPGYVGWPLWYHKTCLVHNRAFGWLYIGGLALGAAWPDMGL